MKIGFFITARLKSSRLKQKILLDLNGKSVLDRVIERAKKVVGIDGVVLCTSTNPQDSVLFENTLDNKIQFYAGSEDDVLERLLGAAKYFGYDAFVSITADNPLFSIYTAGITVDLYKKNRFDFIFTKGLPIGITTYFLDVKALSIALKMKSNTDTEIWGPFVNRPDFFNIGELMVKNSPFVEDKRLTCDYTQDYSLLFKIYSHFPSSSIPCIQNIFDILDRNPKLWKINEMCKQQKQSSDNIQRINSQFDFMKDSGYEYSKKINKKLKPGFTQIEIEI